MLRITRRMNDGSEKFFEYEREKGDPFEIDAHDAWEAGCEALVVSLDGVELGTILLTEGAPREEKRADFTEPRATKAVLETTGANARLVYYVGGPDRWRVEDFREGTRDEMVALAKDLGWEVVEEIAVADVPCGVCGRTAAEHDEAECRREYEGEDAASTPAMTLERFRAIEALMVDRDATIARLVVDGFISNAERDAWVEKEREL